MARSDKLCLCKEILYRPDLATGCKSKSCTFSHAPSGHRGKKKVFEDLFDENKELLANFGFPLDHGDCYSIFVRWLTLRNYNRLFITKFKRYESIKSRFKFFDEVIIKQRSIFFEVCHSRRHYHHNHQGDDSEWARKIGEETKIREAKREDELKAIQEKKRIEEENLRKQREEERKIFEQERAERLMKNDSLISMYERKHAENEKKRQARFELENKKIMELESKKLAENEIKKDEIRINKMLIQSSIDNMEREIDEVKKEEVMLIDQLAKIRGVILDKIDAKKSLEKTLSDTSKELESIDDKLAEEEEKKISLSLLDSWCEKLIEKKTLLQTVTYWLEQAKNVISMPNIEKIYVGEGTFGQVYRITRYYVSGEIRLAQKCPIKYADLSKEAKMREMLGSTVLEGIVTHVAFSSGNIIMRYYQYSLHTLKGKLSKLDINHLMPYILKQLAVGLEKIQSKNYMHNDIKPANILINLDFLDVATLEAVLGDLGSMALRGENASRTPFYESPEHRKGNYTSSRSDIYALGLSMIEFVEDQKTAENCKLTTSALPSDFIHRSLIVRMIDHDYQKRPYVAEIISLLKDKGI